MIDLSEMFPDGKIRSKNIAKYKEEAIEMYRNIKNSYTNVFYRDEYAKYMNKIKNYGIITLQDLYINSIINFNILLDMYINLYVENKEDKILISDYIKLLSKNMDKIGKQ